MNNILFACLIIALLYYFFIYLPQQKKSNPSPNNKSFTHPPKTNSTEPHSVKFPSMEYEPGPQHITVEEKKELEKTFDEIIQGMNELSRDLDNY
jgi:hypothetical protein